MALLLLMQGAMQRAVVFPFWSKNYATRHDADLSSLSPDQLLAALAGFREMIAGILWVRADSFFEEGNYDAVLPMIRIVTMLDPKQIDVYSTGMWHIGYNFADQDNRSDRRYVPSAIALGKEGTRNNPHTYELFFETGWLWHHKVDDDYEQAVDWLQKAVDKKDMPPARRNLLPIALQRAGELEKAVDEYTKLHKEAQKLIDENPNDYLNFTNRDTVENNLDTLLIRMAQRGYLAQKGGYYGQGEYDTNPPFDVGFTARVTVEEPKVLRVEGTWQVLPVGTRIRFIVRDKNYPGARPGGLDWDSQDTVELDPPRDRTYFQDGLFVKNQRFNRRIDMSRDPTMYPFTDEKYTIEFYYNPRSAAHHIQDKFGWDGTGMTDKYNLNTEIRPGVRVIFATLELTRDQIERRGEWSMGRKTPVVETKGFIKQAPSDQLDQIIKVPGLRSG